jgi:hypothetical protein
MVARKMTPQRANESFQKRERRRLRGKGALELIEEAVHLLRSVPLSDLAWYFYGTLPFVLASLYFWGDMSRSPFAAQHLVGAAFALGLLFLWMKTCHTIFSRRMRCLVSGESAILKPSHLWRSFLTQSALQPFGLFLLPLALVPVLPFAWVFAFYQNLGGLDDGETLDIRVVAKNALNQALLWPQQNHVMLAMMSAFGFFVWLNLVTACFVFPALAKMLFGLETVFTRSGLSLLNTTFFAATFGLAYLCVDPIIKTIYALRCFYGQSQRSGADLKAELRLAATLPVSAVAIALAILVLAGQPMNMVAADPPRSTPVGTTQSAPIDRQTGVSSVPAADLDKAIQEVIQEPKYAWRQPRNRLVEEENTQKGFFRRLLDRVKPFLVKTLKTILRWLDALFRRLFSRLRTTGSNDAASRWGMFLRLLLYGLIAATATGLVWLLYRVWKGRHQQIATITSEPLLPIPDLSDENLGAEQLPENSWIALAHKLLASGDLRLALRAFYLASLAQLAGRNLIQLARFKSNKDYERELQRRAHAIPGLLAVFGQNLWVFDRIWYGMHEINREMVTQFASNVEQMRSVGAMPLPSPTT